MLKGPRDFIRRVFIYWETWQAEVPAPKNADIDYHDPALKFMPRGRLVILSGPSCVGKSPLAKALRQFFPDLHKKLQPLILYNSRSPRPGEKNDEDYHFRRREEIEKFRDKDNYIVMDVRGDLQAFDIKELNELLAKGDLFFEGNPFIGETLLSHPKLSKFKRLSMFVSPLSREELRLLKEQPQVDCGIACH